MSLSDDERKIIVRLEIEKAYDRLKAAQVLRDAELWSNAANRLYYALFHSVCALLIHDGYQVSTHRGSRVLFGQYYIKTSKLPGEFGTLYNQMETIRENGDYNYSYETSPEELEERMPAAKTMIDTIAAMVEK